MFGPADNDDELSVSEVAQSGEGALSRVGLQWIRHGEQLLGLGYQQM